MLFLKQRPWSARSYLLFTVILHLSALKQGPVKTGLYDLEIPVDQFMLPILSQNFLRVKPQIAETL